MSTTYRKTESLNAYVTDALSTFHADLEMAEVTIEVLFAVSDKTPALKHHGQPALAIIKPMSQKDRAAGSADARLIVDEDRWEELTERQRNALLDHELQHLKLARAEDGSVKRDDCGRPKLKTRHHDMEIGIFEDVIERHKEHAIESRSFAAMQKVFTQMHFPWGNT